MSKIISLAMPNSLVCFVMTKKFKKQPYKAKFSAKVDQNGKQGIMPSLLKVNRDICQGFLSNFRDMSRFFDRTLLILSIFSQRQLNKLLLFAIEQVKIKIWRKIGCQFVYM